MRRVAVNFGPPDHWYDQPEPQICCSLAEDNPDHDVQACLAEQAENEAERRAEIEREAHLFMEDDVW